MGTNNQASFPKRLWVYQKERFPLFSQGVLIAIFSFSAIAYSRICREAGGFIALEDYLIGVYITLTLFFVLRLFDESKDKWEDAKYRPYLPVPRGLVSLKELNILAWVVIFSQVAVILLFQKPMITLYLPVLIYLLLMRVEFFAGPWLKKRRLMYVATHMVILPMVDIYASGLDWLLAEAAPHWGLAWFFAVSYSNGIVLEFGRKIRSPQNEEVGVDSYTGIFGTRGGAKAYILVLFITMLLSMGASYYAGFPIEALLIFVVLFAICAWPAVSFMRQPTPKKEKWIEYASAIWTGSMYLALGGIPMLKTLLS